MNYAEPFGNCCCAAFWYMCAVQAPKAAGQTGRYLDSSRAEVPVLDRVMMAAAQISNAVLTADCAMTSRAGSWPDSHVCGVDFPFKKIWDLCIITNFFE